MHARSLGMVRFPPSSSECTHLPGYHCRCVNVRHHTLLLILVQPSLQVKPPQGICHATARWPPFPVNYMSWFPSELRGKAVPLTESPYSSQVSEQDNRTPPSCHMVKSWPIRGFPAIEPRMVSANQRLSCH